MLNAVVFALVGLSVCHVSFAEDPRNDPADQLFTKCCEEKGLPCVKDCWYRAIRDKSIRRGEPGEPKPSCMYEEYFEAYNQCATGPTNNTDCCKKAGVFVPLCLELCDGTRPLRIKDPKAYFDCAKFRYDIVTCDHDMNLLRYTQDALLNLTANSHH